MWFFILVCFGGCILEAVAGMPSSAVLGGVYGLVSVPKSSLSINVWPDWDLGNQRIYAASSCFIPSSCSCVYQQMAVTCQVQRSCPLMLGVPRAINMVVIGLSGLYVAYLCNVYEGSGHKVTAVMALCCHLKTKDIF